MHVLIATVVILEVILVGGFVATVLGDIDADSWIGRLTVGIVLAQLFGAALVTVGFGLRTVVASIQHDNVAPFLGGLVLTVVGGGGVAWCGGALFVLTRE